MTTTPMKPATEKLHLITGIHSLSESVIDEAPTRISDVDDDSSFGHTEASFVKCIDGARTALEEVNGDKQEVQRLEIDDEAGRVINLKGGHFWPQMDSTKISGLSMSLKCSQRGVQEEDQELSQPSKLQHRTLDRTPESENEHYLQRSIVEGLGRPISNIENAESYAKEIDIAPNLEKSALETQERYDSAQPSGLSSDSAVFYTQQLEPEDIINPFTLEDRIRKAREDQDYAMQLEVETLSDMRRRIPIIGNSGGSILDDGSSSITEMKPIYYDHLTKSSQRGFDGHCLSSGLKERQITESPSKDLAEGNLSRTKAGAGEAVLLGALASGVNRPTWVVIRTVLVALVASLVLLLQVAIQCGSWFVILNVLFLIAIAGALILLLTWYISEIGLVSVEKQMAELNLSNGQTEGEYKTL